MNLKQVVRGGLFRTLGLLGLGRLLHARNMRAGRIPVVVLHRVSPQPDPYWPPYTPDSFARLIRFLGRRYRFLSVEDLFTRPLDDLRGGIVITFDDAWHDFATHALPVLREQRIPVVQFVATTPIEERSLIWTSQLDQAFRHTTAVSLHFSLGDRSHQFALGDHAHRLRAAGDVQQLLKRAPEQQRQQALADVLAQLGTPPHDPAYRLCTWEELRALTPEVRFHAHTATHPFLPHVEDDVRLDAELSDCQQCMEDRLGVKALYLAYPMGGHDARVMARAAERYQAAFATGNSLVDLVRLRNSAEYRYQLPRFNLTDLEPHEAYLRLNGFHGWLVRLVGRAST